MGTPLAPLLPKRWHSPPIFWPVRCGQMAGWIKMVVDAEVDVSPGDFVFHRDPAVSRKKDEAPSRIFSTFLLQPNGWIHQDSTWHFGRPQRRRRCVRCSPSLLPKTGRSPQFSANEYCGQTAALMKMEPTVANLQPISIAAKRLDA